MKTRLKRGVNWHAWAWKDDGIGLLRFATLIRNPPDYDMRGCRGGHWVRVKFVEVTSRDR